MCIDLYRCFLSTCGIIIARRRYSSPGSRYALVFVQLLHHCSWEWVGSYPLVSWIPREPVHCYSSLLALARHPSVEGWCTLAAAVVAGLLDAIDQCLALFVYQGAAPLSIDHGLAPQAPRVREHG